MRETRLASSQEMVRRLHLPAPIAEEVLRETHHTSSVEKVGRFHPSAQKYIMGEQVANNRETQEVMYLHEKDGVWYILSEPKSPGLVKKEYIPMGNRLVYPKKWGRKQAAEVLLSHLITDNENTKRTVEQKLDILNKLKEEIKDWK